MRRALLAAAAALLAAVSIVGCGSSNDAASSDTLRVGTEGTYSPFSYQGPDGQLTGYDVEVTQAVGAKLGGRSSSSRRRGTRSSPASRPSASTSSPTR